MTSSPRLARLSFAFSGLVLSACSTPAQVPAAAVKRPATCAEASLSLPADAVVATLGGKPVTMKDLGDDVAKAEGKALRDYCDQVHAARAGALDGYVTQQLVENAAKAANQTPDEWVQAQVEKHTAPPTDADIQAFYDQRKRPDAPPLEAVRDQVVAILTRERNLEALEKLFADLKKDGQLVEQLPDVRAPAVQIDTAATTPVKGTRGAKVKVVEFADFECPYCSRAADTMREIAKRYGDKIELSYRHFPLRQIHPNAQRASEVAVCAGEQGKFWEMHDALYAAQQDLPVAIGEGLEEQGKKLQLDGAKLTECLASGRASAVVDADYKIGSELGVEGTPSIYVNGRQVPGGATVEAVAAAIDAEL